MRIRSILALLALQTAAIAQPTITLSWKESGIFELTRGMRPKGLLLSETRPAGITKLPDGLKSPRYASFELGLPEARATYHVVLDETDGKPSALIVDTNANGDLTDETPLTFTTRPSHDPEGGDATSYEAGVSVTIPFKSGPKQGRIQFYQTRAEAAKFDDNFRKSLSCYADYGLVGEANLDGKTIPAALEDAGLKGDFRLGDNPSSQPLFWIGVPDGPRNHIGKTVLASRPFEVNGKWWALADITAEGSCRIVESTKPAGADAQPKGPKIENLTGKIAPSFTAKLLDGGNVNFPGDYKGKIVLIDFWATWCGPCVAELPNVIAAYGKYHDQGLEVLGVSLDKEGAAQKLTEFTQKKGMPWKQVYEGAFWNTAPAKLYNIHAIPRMMLIDGDTGMVLDDDSLRGEALAPAIEKALASKKKPD